MRPTLFHPRLPLHPSDREWNSEYGFPFAGHFLSEGTAPCIKYEKMTEGRG